MYRVGDWAAVVVGASDHVAFLDCRHTRILGFQVADRLREKPKVEEFEEVHTLHVERRGSEHEEAYLPPRGVADLAVATIDAPEGPGALSESGDGPDEDGLERLDPLRSSVSATVLVVTTVTDIVCQAAFLYDSEPYVGWRGHAECDGLADPGQRPSGTRVPFALVGRAGAARSLAGFGLSSTDEQGVGMYGQPRRDQPPAGLAQR